MADTPGNLADLVRLAADRAPDRVAFVAGGERLTWRQTDAAVDAAARGLCALGLGPGDRVALHLVNGLDFVVSYFGALRAGIVAVPLATTYAPAELERALGECGAKVLLTGAADAVDPTAVPSVERIVVAGPELDAALGAHGGPEVVAGASGEDLAVIAYTSGTGGAPRGVMLSHRALLANLDQIARIEPPVVDGDDVLLLVVPFSHAFGLNAALGLVAKVAATGVLTPGFEPAGTLALIRAEEVSVLVGVPPMFVAWSRLPDAEEGFTSVRLCLSGSAPLPAGVQARVLEMTGHHVFEGYGLTEAAPVLTATLRSEIPKPDSIGRPLPGVELQLLDAAGQPVEDGDPGEIVVRGANLFSGYWPDGASAPDADGWFRTGDVAYADEEGDLHLVDRRRELILVSGFSVFPREVEQVLLDHPLVHEVAVIGIPHPYTGESVKAYVVPVAGAALTVADVQAHAAVSLARFKCPTTVELVEALPHSTTGRVSKSQLRTS